MDATKWIIKTRWNCNCVTEKRGVKPLAKVVQWTSGKPNMIFLEDDRLLTYCSKHHFEQFRHHSRRHKLLGKIYNLYFFRTTWLDPLSWRHKDKSFTKEIWISWGAILASKFKYIFPIFLLLATKFEFLLIFNHYEKISKTSSIIPLGPKGKGSSGRSSLRSEI